MKVISGIGDKVKGKGVAFFNGFREGAPGVCDAGIAFINIEGNPGGVGVGYFLVDVFLEVDFGLIV
jgi:hypothetical protein